MDLQIVEIGFPPSSTARWARPKSLCLTNCPTVSGHPSISHGFFARESERGTIWRCDQFLPSLLFVQFVHPACLEIRLHLGGGPGWPGGKAAIKMIHWPTAHIDRASFETKPTDQMALSRMGHSRELRLQIVPRVSPVAHEASLQCCSNANSITHCLQTSKCTTKDPQLRFLKSSGVNFFHVTFDQNTIIWLRNHFCSQVSELVLHVSEVLGIENHFDLPARCFRCIAPFIHCCQRA